MNKNEQNYPDISVHITTFNRQNLLKKAIQGVISQTLIPKEIIVVDDCSSDNTTSTILKLKQSIPQLVYIKNHKNLGNGCSRNIALKHTSSSIKYIAFLDDDDFWFDKLHLEKSLNELKISKRRYVCCGVIKKFSPNKLVKYKIEEPKNIKTFILKGNGIIHSPTIVIEKKLLDNVNGFSEEIKRGVDSHLYRRLIIKYKEIPIFSNRISVEIDETNKVRMTDQQTIQGWYTAILAHFYTLRYFWLNFLFHPFCALQRLKNILISLKKIIFLLLK